MTVRGRSRGSEEAADCASRSAQDFESSGSVKFAGVSDEGGVIE
jgi:hypothetical protein